MCVEEEPKHIYNLFHFRRDSAHSLQECPAFHRLGPVQVTRIGLPAGRVLANMRKWEEQERPSQAPEQLSVVLGHLGYSVVVT